MTKPADRPLNPANVEGVGRKEDEQTPEEAFEAFCRERYSRLVATVNLIVHDSALALDITQETFARAYLQWAKLWPHGNPSGWVHRVATNLAISFHRRAAREARALARLRGRETQTVPAPEAYPELHRAVAGLPPRQRAAVALHYTLGLPIDDVAKAMGCRPGTVKSLLHSARQKIKKQLGDE